MSRVEQRIQGAQTSVRTPSQFIPLCAVPNTYVPAIGFLADLICIHKTKSPDNLVRTSSELLSSDLLMLLCSFLTSRRNSSPSGPQPCSSPSPCRCMSPASLLRAGPRANCPTWGSAGRIGSGRHIRNDRHPQSAHNLEHLGEESLPCLPPA